VGAALPRAATVSSQYLLSVKWLLALLLLVGAGLMLRTLFQLWGLDPGFNPRNVMTFGINGPSFKDQLPMPKRAAYRQIHDKLVTLPGIEAASFNWGAHPMQNDNEEYFWIAGKPKPAHQSDLPFGA